MRKFFRIAFRTLLIILAVNVIVVLSLQALLNSRMVSDMIYRALAEVVDGKLEYSGLRVSMVKDFPKIKVSVDSVTLSYPHGRFSEYDMPCGHNCLLDAGRGRVSDTLAHFDGFSAQVDVWHLLAGRIRLDKARLSGLRFYMHFYEEGRSNFEALGSCVGREKPDSSDSSVSLPWISVGEISIDDASSVVFTMQESAIYGSVGLKKLMLGGKVKVNPDDIRIRSAMVRLESLGFKGYVNGGSVDYNVDRLDVIEKYFNRYDVSLSSDAIVDIGGTGRFDIPLSLDADIGLRIRNNVFELKIPELGGNVAYIPIKVNGEFSAGGDSIPVNARLEIKGIPLETMAREYGSVFLKDMSELKTDGCMNVTVVAVGVLDDGLGTVPAISARVTVPDTRIVCEPWRADGNIAIDVEGSINAKKYAKVKVHKMESRVPGLDLNAGAVLDDILGENPSLSLNATADLDVGSVIRAAGLDTIMDASGNVMMRLDAFTCKSDLDSMAFSRGSVSGEILCGDLLMTMPGDTISARVFRPEIRFNSSADGMKLNFDIDSAGFRMGSMMAARIRGMKNRIEIFKVESRGLLVPKVECEHSDRSLFFRYGDNRVFVQNIGVGAALEKRVRRVFGDRKKIRTLTHSHSAGDINIALDSAYAQYLDAWKPSGFIKIERGMAVTPYFPLRMRLRSFGADFDGDKLSLERFTMEVGSTDLTMKGYAKGLGRALRKKGFIETNLDVHSHKANVNEVLAAINAGKEIPKNVDPPVSETDESFVIDTLDKADFQIVELEKFLLPSNLLVEAKVSADSVKVGPVNLAPVSASVTLKKRALQFMYAEASSDRGDMECSGFFSTPSFEDLRLGLDLKLKNVSAERIIELVPQVDSLMPVLKSFKGNLGCEMAATARMDQDMNLIIPSVDGMIRISGEKMNISDAGHLRLITSFLMFRNKNIGDIGNLYVSGMVHDNKLEIFPFILSVDRYELALSGVQGFDQTLDYHASILKSPLMLKFGVNLTGSIDKPVVKLCQARYKSRDIPVFTAELDSIQLNIAESIKDIYTRGLKNLSDYGRKRGLYYQGGTSDGGNLSLEELARIDSLRLQYDLEDESEALTGEVEKILEETSRSPEIPASEPKYEAVGGKGMLSKLLDSFKGGKKKGD